MSKAVSIKDDQFEVEVLQSDKPVLVDFWAEWCPPCKALKPFVEELSDSNDNVKVVTMNIDEAPETPTKFGVRSIPTLMMFKDGKLSATKVGGMSKEDLNKWVSDEG